MNDLIEIEKRYCREVVGFFCKEIPLLLIPSSNDLNQLRSYIHSRLCSHFQSRLYGTQLVKEFRVEVNLLDKDKRRDSVIDNILDDSKILEPSIIVILKYNDFTFETLEQRIDFLI